MRLTAKIYALTLISTGLVLSAAVVAANVLIDPQGVFGTGLLISDRYANQRHARYLNYKRSTANVTGLFFASSRGAGIPLAALSARSGVNHADFGVPYGVITDHLPVLERAIRDKQARGERLKQVFLLLDIDLLGDRPITNRTAQGYLHPEITGEQPLRYWSRYLMAIQFRTWFDELRYATQRSNRAAADTAKASDAKPAAAGATATAPQVPAKLDRVTIQIEYQRQLAVLRRFAGLCRDHGTELIVAISPLHRANFGKHDREDLMAAVTDVSRITPVWDFGSPPWMNDRPRYWRDDSHFTPEVGRLMLNRIFAGQGPPDDLQFGQLRRPPSEPSAR
jgi:hypothetical protein